MTCAPQQALPAPRRFLIRRGFEILDVGWECDAGTVDVVARNDDTLVFAEVKTKVAANKGFPDEAVTQAKRDRNERIAMAFIADFDEVDLTVGFDVVSNAIIAPDRALVQHHISAFSASGGCGAGESPGGPSPFSTSAVGRPLRLHSLGRRLGSRPVADVFENDKEGVASCRLSHPSDHPAVVCPQAQASGVLRRADARRAQ